MDVSEEEVINLLPVEVYNVFRKFSFTSFTEVQVFLRKLLFGEFFGRVLFFIEAH